MTAASGESSTIRRRVRVHGRVQAVGFRASCQARAVDAGLGGWVRNTENGDVEAVFEGFPRAVEELVAWCGEGPPWAKVDHVDVAPEQPRGETSFTVR